MATQTTTDTQEIVSLIGSDKVEGTRVYHANGERAGTIERVMIDKRCGTIAYAVMSFGGSWGWARITTPFPSRS